MQISKLRVTCLIKKCGTVFDAEYVSHAPVAVATASLGAIRCPKCGSAKIGMGGNYDDAPALSDPIGKRIEWWRTRGEHGTSSCTIFDTFQPSNLLNERDDIPHDPDDFKRCHQLLSLIPEWRREIGLVAVKYPQWKPFVDRWAQMEELYVAELPTGTAPKLYAMIKAASVEAETLR